MFIIDDAAPVTEAESGDMAELLRKPNEGVLLCDLKIKRRVNPPAIAERICIT